MYSILNLSSVIFFYCKFAELVLVSSDHIYNYVNLPESHMIYYFNSFPKVIDECLTNNSCVYRSLLSSERYNSEKCWGYEPDCAIQNTFSQPKCLEKKPAWIRSHDAYMKTFYDQADFGKEHIKQNLSYIFS